MTKFVLLKFILIVAFWTTSSHVTTSLFAQADDTALTPITQLNLQWAVRRWLQNREEAFAEYGYINDWDTSEVTDMSSLFDTYSIMEAAAFNDDISSWDTSSVTSTAYMFNGARAFQQNIASWNVSSVTDFEFMFGACESFNAPIGNWDVSHVTNMAFAFVGAKSFDQPLDSWDVSNVEFFNGMFFGAHTFNQPLCNNWDTSKATTLASMFFDAQAFNQDISCWNTSNVAQFGLTFMRATAFNQDISSWNVGNAVDLKRMFHGASSFNQNLNGWDVSSVLTSAFAFQDAESFSHVLCWDLPQKANVEDMFCGSAGRFDSLCSSTLTIYMSELSCNDSNINPFLRTPAPTITSRPSTSPVPSMTPSASLQPTITPQPSPAPSRSPRPSASPKPSAAPSFTPTSAPSISMQPSKSVQPSMSPSVSPQPSTTPSISLDPTISSSASPSVSSMPTETPFTGEIEIQSLFQIYSGGFDTSNSLKPGSIVRIRFQQAYEDVARKIVAAAGTVPSMTTSESKRQFIGHNHNRQSAGGHRQLEISFVDASVDNMVDTPCDIEQEAENDSITTITTVCQNVYASFRVSLEDEFQMRKSRELTLGMNQAIEDGTLLSELLTLLPNAPIVIKENLAVSETSSDAPSMTPSIVPTGTFTGRVTIETDFLTYTTGPFTANDFEVGELRRDQLETAFEETAIRVVAVLLNRKQRQLLLHHREVEVEDELLVAIEEGPAPSQRRLSVTFVDSSINIIADTTCPEDVEELTSTNTPKSCQNILASFRVQLENENKDDTTSLLEDSINAFVDNGILKQRLREVNPNHPMNILEGMELNKYQGRHQITSTFVVSNAVKLRAVALENSDWFAQLKDAHELVAQMAVQNYSSQRRHLLRQQQEAVSARHLSVEYASNGVYAMDSECPNSVTASDVYCQNMYTSFYVDVVDEFLHEIETPITELMARYIEEGVLQNVLDGIDSSNPINVLQGEELTELLGTVPSPSPTIPNVRSTDNGESGGLGVGQIIGVGFAAAGGCMLTLGGVLFLYNRQQPSPDQPKEIQFESNNYQGFPDNDENGSGGDDGGISTSREIFQDEPGNWESESMRKTFEDPEVVLAMQALGQTPGDKEEERDGEELESYEVVVVDTEEPGIGESEEDEDESDSSDSEEDSDTDNELGENDNNAGDGIESVEQENSTSNAGWTTGDDVTSKDSDESEDESFDEPIQYLNNSLINIGAESQEPDIFKDEEGKDQDEDTSPYSRQEPEINRNTPTHYGSNIDLGGFSI